MTIKSSGPLSLSEIAAEFGGTAPLNLSNYYGMATGLPTNGTIKASNFYGKTFVVAEIITSNRIWTPKPNFARNIHIFVIGAGGSGGASWPERNGGTYNNTDGVSAASGGGAGGVSYSRIAASQATPSNIVIGTGGAGVRSGSFNSSSDGNFGSASSFTGSGLQMVANGGQAGLGRTNSDGGSTGVTAPGVSGGTASGGTISNFTGGSSGTASITVSDVGLCASGGGAPAFQPSHESMKNSADASGQTATAGAKVSDYGSWPSMLNAYPLSRNQAAILASNILSYDGSDGVRGGGSNDVTYGGGSGGIATESGAYSGRGGNGVVVIIYEI